MTSLIARGRERAGGREEMPVERLQAVGTSGSKGQILQQINCKEQKGVEEESLSIKRDSKEIWDLKDGKTTAPV